jgi:hypothetical protein
MTTIASQTLFTPDDVLALEEEGLYELVDGRLVEKKRVLWQRKRRGLLPVH